MLLFEKVEEFSRQEHVIFHIFYIIFIYMIVPDLANKNVLINVDVLFFPSEFEWSFSQDLSAILVKQEEPDMGQRLDPQPLEGPPLILSPAPPHRSPWRHTVSIHQTR